MRTTGARGDVNDRPSAVAPDVSSPLDAPPRLASSLPPEEEFSSVLWRFGGFSGAGSSVGRFLSASRVSASGGGRPCAGASAARRS
jgi:hypothetical protein